MSAIGKGLPPAKKNCTTLVFHFSWVLQSPQREIEDNAYAYAGLGGGGGKQGVFWEICKWINGQKAKYGY